MGIKENFSQAVKELWKKDGQEETGENITGQPSTLDKYLADQNGESAAEQSAPVQPVQPAQTAQTVNPVQSAPVQQEIPSQSAQTAQVSQPVQSAQNAETPLETPYYRTAPQSNPAPENNGYAQNAYQNNAGFNGAPNGYNGAPNGYNADNGGFNGNMNGGFGGGYVPPTGGNANIPRSADNTDEITVISKNTIIDGNVRSLANMQLDGSIKGNVDTTRNIEMTGKIVGDVSCNNANMNSAAMQGNVTLKGKMRMDRDTILIGDLTSQYADVNGRIRGKLEIAGKAELKRDAIVFGDINASTIAVTDGAIIQGYVNTTFLSKEDSRNVFPEAISLDQAKDASTT